MIYLWSDFIENGAKWLTENEILNFAISQGIIDISSVQEKIEMTKREELLKKHIYKIWQSKDKNWYTYLPDEVKGRVQRKRKSQEEIEQVVIDYWKTEEENPTIDQVFNEWNDRKLELQQIGRDTYIRNQQFYNRHYQKFGKRRIKGVSEDEFSDFLEAQIPEHKLKAKAFSGLKTITRGFLKRAKKKKYITFHVEAMLDDLDISEQSFEKSNKSSEDRAFTEKEFPRLLHYLCSNINVHNLGILLMCITGMRVGELVTIKYEDFISPNLVQIKRTETRFKDETDTWRYEVKESPKTEAGNRIAIIPKYYSWIYQELRKENPFGEFVMSDENGERLRTSHIRRRLYAICRELGFDKEKGTHTCRRTYASILLDNNVDRSLITGQVGHTDIDCTEKHYHEDRKSPETKIKILSEIPDFTA